MADESEEDLEEIEGELLPEREAMSVISTGIHDPMPLPMVEPLEDGEEP